MNRSIIRNIYYKRGFLALTEKVWAALSNNDHLQTRGVDLVSGFWALYEARCSSCPSLSQEACKIPRKLLVLISSWIASKAGSAC